jgi:hypothetical protein
VRVVLSRVARWIEVHRDVFLGTSFLLLRQGRQNLTVGPGQRWLHERARPKSILANDRDLKSKHADLRGEEQEPDEPESGADRTVKVGAATELMAHKLHPDRLE